MMSVRLSAARRWLVVCVVTVLAVAAPLPAAAQSPEAPVPPDWLGVVNHYRAQSGLPPVREEAAWSDGIRKHLAYLERTPASLRAGQYASAHTQNPASPWFSPDGAEAARSSNLGGGSSDREAVEGWMRAPFHAIGILRPGLRRVAFGRAGERAGLDVIRGLEAAPRRTVLFPGPDSVIPGSLQAFTGESPDPTEACPWRGPSGLPFIAMFDTPVPAGTTATVTGPTGPLAAGDVCVVTQHTYRPSDPVYGPSGRALLEGDNAVFVIPRHRLRQGRYTVRIDRPGSAPTVWSFTSGAARGYRLVDRSGRVHTFGSLLPVGAGVRANAEATAVASTPDGEGVAVLWADGLVTLGGTAAWGGPRPNLAPGERATSIAYHPTGNGGWIFTSRGRAVAWGSATHRGDMSGVPLNAPVIGSAVTPSGNGYWMVAADGGIFSFGDARFAGSMGGQRLNEPVVGLVPDPDGAGYWLIAADGGVFAFDAPFRGSIPGVLARGQRLNRPVVAGVASGAGYLMLGADGGVFAFGTTFQGSMGATGSAVPIVGITVAAQR